MSTDGRTSRGNPGAARQHVGALIDVPEQTLRLWVEAGSGQADVLDEPGKAELKRANGILKAAASFFAAEGDRPQKYS